MKCCCFWFHSIVIFFLFFTLESSLYQKCSLYSGERSVPLGALVLLPQTCMSMSFYSVKWWFVNPDTFLSSRYFRINKFSGLLNRPSVQERKSVTTLFVRISEISGLSEPGLTNHHCILSPTGCLYSYPIVEKTEVLIIKWRHNFNNYTTSIRHVFMTGKRSVKISKVK